MKKFAVPKKVFDWLLICSALLAIIATITAGIKSDDELAIATPLTFSAVLALPAVLGGMFKFTGIKNKDVLSYGMFTLACLINAAQFVILLNTQIKLSDMGMSAVLFAAATFVMAGSLIIAILFTVLSNYIVGGENSSDIKAKFTRLAALKEQQFINDEEYEEKRSQLVKEMKL